MMDRIYDAYISMSGPGIISWPRYEAMYLPGKNGGIVSKPIVVFTIIIFIAQMIPISRDSLLVDAGLIHIYHRYRPRSTETLNSSSSMQTFEQSVEEPDQHNINTREIEFSSPMKRIMELIGHHQPVIVVSSDSPPSNSPTQIQASTEARDQQQLKNPENSMVSLVQTPMTSLQTAAINPFIANNPDGQQWSLYSPNQNIQPAVLSGQQQQLIQTSVPFEQYYIAPGSGVPNPYAVLPASLGFNPSNSFQPIAPMTFGPQASQLQQISNLQQQAAQQQISGIDDRTQPVFLSSYVPEVPLQQVPRQPSVSPASTHHNPPTSIQQIQQQSQEPEAKKSGVDAKKSSSDDSNDQSHETDKPQSGDSDNMDDEGGRGGSNSYEPDDDETSKSKRSHQNDLGEPRDDMEEPSSSGGSSTYHDKYDSDKEEPRTVTTNHYKAEPSNIVNGLKNVGLNDDCLQCICRASSGCDHLLRCITRGAEEKFCGPFQLTEEYWNRAGSPGDAANNFISFEDCANDADCAVETVTNYMKKYHKDCDGDENITCMDYARLHRLRPDECDNTDKLINNFDAYWAKFQRCAEGYNRSRNGDDEDI